MIWVKSSLFVLTIVTVKCIFKFINDNINKNNIAIAPTYTNIYNNPITPNPVKYKYILTFIYNDIKYIIDTIALLLNITLNADITLKYSNNIIKLLLY